MSERPSGTAERPKKTKSPSNDTPATIFWIVITVIAMSALGWWAFTSDATQQKAVQVRQIK